MEFQDFLIIVLIFYASCILFGLVSPSDHILYKIIFEGGSWEDLLSLKAIIEMGTSILIAGGAILATIVTRDQFWIFIGFSTFIYTFITLQFSDLFLNRLNLPEPLGFIIYGIFTGVILLSAIEWARGKA